jgi:hypothetical protein
VSNRVTALRRGTRLSRGAAHCGTCQRGHVMNSNIFDLKSSVLFPPFEVGSSMLNVRSSDYLSFVFRLFKSRSSWICLCGSPSAQANLERNYLPWRKINYFTVRFDAYRYCAWIESFYDAAILDYPIIETCRYGDSFPFASSLCDLCG